MGGARRARLSGALLAAALAALAADRALADPAAWRIAGANGGEIVLLGSVHVLRAADYPLPPLVDELFGRADALVMELDLDDLDPAAEQAAVLDAALLPPGTALADTVDARVYRLAAESARSLGIDLAVLARFEPWLVAVTLLDQGLARIGFEPERGVERYFVARARAAHKEIAGLESLESQLAIFDALPPGQQQALLEQTVHELDSAPATMAELADAWRAGRLDELSERLLEDFGDFPGLYAALVTERNRAWTEALERRLGDGRRYLVVVGALHLVGPDNVIEMLAARGHRAERVR